MHVKKVENASKHTHKIHSNKSTVSQVS